MRTLANLFLFARGAARVEVSLARGAARVDFSLARGAARDDRTSSTRRRRAGSFKTIATLAAALSACACDACGGAREAAAPPAPKVEYWSPPEAGAEPLAAESVTPGPDAVPPAGEQAAQPPPDPGAPGFVPPAPQTPKTKPPKQRSSLGMNVGQVTYYAEQIVFLDLVKQAADWGLNAGGLLPKLDEQGWPKALQPGHQAGFIARTGKGGRHVILYEGEGKLDITHGGNTVSSGPGREVVNLERGDVHFTLVRTDPKNPMRKIRIVPIENERDHEQVVFHPRFLELVKSFSVLRFMDFLQINGSKQKRWQDRPKADDYSQGTEKGAAIEYAIELCNRVRADCWLNVPHMADDDYVRRYAQLVAERLDPDLRAYVEYSNEVWNFEHGDWIQQQGEKQGMPKHWDTRLQYQAKRSVEIFDIFEKALGRQRLVRVLAGQFWDLRLQILLDYNKAYEHTDAIAIAPYFCAELAGDETVGQLRPLSAQQIAQKCDEDIERVRERMKGIKKLADHYKLPLIGYEGGQHLVTGGGVHEDEALQRKLDQAQLTPTMGKAYDHYLSMWRDEGGEIMVLYKLVESSSKWGRWGLLENMWQPTAAAPKYMATMAFMQRQPRWWKDAPAPAPAAGSARKAAKE
jgi:hypothetical protein